jgi:hypothetical protein
MASPPFDILQGKPADTDIVSQHPADERQMRDRIESAMAVEHDMGDASTAKGARHKFGVGNTTTRNAITDWVVGSFWINSTTVPAVLEYVKSLGPTVWEALSAILATTTEVLTGTDATKYVSPDSLAALWEQGSNVASAATVSLGEGGYFVVTGTTTITDIDFATDKAGRKAWVRFSGALTLTNGANLILPGAANITTVAGDMALFVSEGSDVVRCPIYWRAASKPPTIPLPVTDLDTNGATLVNNPANGGFVPIHDATAGAGRKARIGEVGGWVPLEEQTASSSAQIDFVLTSYLTDFEDFKVVINNAAPATDNVDLYMRFSTDGGSTFKTGTEYTFVTFTTTTAAGGVSSGSAGAAQFQLVGANGIGNAANETWSGWVEIINPNATARTAYTGEGVYFTNAGVTNHVLSTSGYSLTVENTDAVRFLMSSGNIASGKFTLHGRRKVT